MYRHTSTVSNIFTKGDNFCHFPFASLDDRSPPKKNLLLILLYSEGIFLKGSRVFPVRVVPHGKGQQKCKKYKIETARFVSLESVPIHLAPH